MSFGDFQTWLTTTVHDCIRINIQHEIKTVATTLGVEIKELKGEVKKLKEDNVATKIELKELKETTQNNNNETIKNKETSENNLKYLINLDRDKRQCNVILFGLPENENIKCIIENSDGRREEAEASNDEEKVKLLFRHINCNNVLLSNMFRLGKQMADIEKPRPIKICLPTSRDAKNILSKCKKLSELDFNVYIKSDKTKTEMTEFKRIGKAKEDLLKRYPIENGNEERVTLIKGVLTVDGEIVDRYNPVQSLF